jgi:lysophospholipase L1-like esterase
MANQNFLLLAQLIRRIANTSGNLENDEAVFLEKVMNQTVVINNNNNTVGGSTTTDASQLTSGTLPDARLSTNVALKNDVNNAIANLVNSSPAALDTLNELATALGNDPNFATTITNALAGKVNTSDIVNALTQVATGKLLDASQGKILNDAITSHTSLINSRLQTETQTYLNNIITAGGYIDAVTIQALDQFVVTGKRDGWWLTVKEFAPLLGADLTSALVKFKTVTGSNSLVNNNLVAADYKPSVGFSLTANTNKYLGTSFVPSAYSLAGNISLSAVIPDYNENTSGSGFIISDNPVSGEAQIYIAANKPISSMTMDSRGAAHPGGIRTLTMHYNTSNQYQSYCNGVLMYDYSAQTFSSALNTEITIFKATRSGVVYYQYGSISGLIITSSLTAAQALSINLAMQQLYQSVGRLPIIGGFAEFFGDSITAGQLASGVQKRWAYLTTQSIGLNEMNWGMPSSQLRQTATNVTGGYQRYIQSMQRNAQTLFCMYGTNDMKTGDVSTNGDSTITTDLQTKLTTMVNAWKAQGKRVILLSPPYCTAVNAAKNLFYAAAIATVAKNTKVPFADTNNALNDTGSPATYLSDGTHPNDNGYAIVAEYAVYAYRGQLVRKPTLDFPSIAANSQADLVVTVYNAVVGMSVNITPLGTIEAGIIPFAFVSANDTVTVRLTNTTGSAIDPVSLQYKVTVFLNY